MGGFDDEALRSTMDSNSRPRLPGQVRPGPSQGMNLRRSEEQQRNVARDPLLSMSVSDARRSLAHIRSRVTSKQKEMQEIVGQRYHEMLTAAETVCSMHESARELTQILSALPNSVHKLEEGAEVLEGPGGWDSFSQHMQECGATTKPSYADGEQSQKSSAFTHEPSQSQHCLDMSSGPGTSDYRIQIRSKEILKCPERIWQLLDSGRAFDALQEFVTWVRGYLELERSWSVGNSTVTLSGSPLFLELPLDMPHFLNRIIKAASDCLEVRGFPVERYAGSLAILFLVGYANGTVEASSNSEKEDSPAATSDIEVMVDLFDRFLVAREKCLMDILQETQTQLRNWETGQEYFRKLVRKSRDHTWPTEVVSSPPQQKDILYLTKYEVIGRALCYLCRTVMDTLIEGHRMFVSDDDSLSLLTMARQISPSTYIDRAEWKLKMANKLQARTKSWMDSISMKIHQGASVMLDQLQQAKQLLWIQTYVARVLEAYMGEAPQSYAAKPLETGSGNFVAESSSAVKTVRQWLTEVSSGLLSQSLPPHLRTSPDQRSQTLNARRWSLNLWSVLFLAPFVRRTETLLRSAFQNASDQIWDILRTIATAEAPRRGIALGSTVEVLKETTALREELLPIEPEEELNPAGMGEPSLDLEEARTWDALKLSLYVMGQLRFCLDDLHSISRDESFLFVSLKPKSLPQVECLEEETAEDDTFVHASLERENLILFFRLLHTVRLIGNGLREASTESEQPLATHTARSVEFKDPSNTSPSWEHSDHGVKSAGLGDKAPSEGQPETSDGTCSPRTLLMLSYLCHFLAQPNSPLLKMFLKRDANDSTRSGRMEGLAKSLAEIVPSPTLESLRQVFHGSGAQRRCLRLDEALQSLKDAGFDLQGQILLSACDRSQEQDSQSMTSISFSQFIMLAFYARKRMGHASSSEIVHNNADAREVNGRPQSSLGKVLQDLGSGDIMRDLLVFTLVEEAQVLTRSWAGQLIEPILLPLSKSLTIERWALPSKEWRNSHAGWEPHLAEEEREDGTSSTENLWLPSSISQSLAVFLFTLKLESLSSLLRKMSKAFFVLPNSSSHGSHEERTHIHRGEDEGGVIPVAYQRMIRNTILEQFVEHAVKGLASQYVSVVNKLRRCDPNDDMLPSKDSEEDQIPPQYLQLLFDVYFINDIFARWAPLQRSTSRRVYTEISKIEEDILHAIDPVSWEIYSTPLRDRVQKYRSCTSFILSFDSEQLRRASGQMALLDVENSSRMAKVPEFRLPVLSDRTGSGHFSLLPVASRRGSRNSLAEAEAAVQELDSTDKAQAVGETNYASMAPSLGLGQLGSWGIGQIQEKVVAGSTLFNPRSALLSTAARSSLFVSASSFLRGEASSQASDDKSG